MFWHNAAETWIDIDHQTSASSVWVDTHWFSESGVIDLFLLLGPTVTDVFQQYRQLTGATPLPPVGFA